ncbi:unknown [Oscillibacter sp. CAG:155]|nr:unknown [Oscillibacter sp. CAG:155]
MGGVLTGEGGHGGIDHAHLRAVAVGHNHLMALFNEIHNGPGSMLHGGHLFRQILAQSVAAQSDDNAFTHSGDTSSKI